MMAMSQPLQSDLCRCSNGTATKRPSLPKLDTLAVDADGEPQVEWEAEDDIKGGCWIYTRSQGNTVFWRQGGV